MESSTRRKNTMIIAGMVVLTILAFLLINFFSGPGTDPGETAGPSKQALIEEIEELESSIVELEVVFTELNINQDMNESLLEEKRDEIKRFDQMVEEQKRKIEDLQAKLAEARRRGDVDQETIENLQAQIEEAQATVQKIDNEFTQQEIEFLYMENRKLTATVDSLERMKPDSLLELLGDVRAQLNDCGTASPVLTQGGTEVDPEDVQEAIVNLRNNRQKAELELFNKTKTGEEKLSSSEKARKMNLVYAKYQITDSNIEKFLDGSEMYLVVTDVSGKEITSNNNSPSIKRCKDGNCVVAGEGYFKSGEGITFVFQPKDGKWEKDETYMFSIYIDGNEVKREILLLN